MDDQTYGMSLREFARYMKRLTKANPGALLDDVLADPKIRDTLRRRGVSVNGLPPIEGAPSRARSQPQNDPNPANY